MHLLDVAADGCDFNLYLVFDSRLNAGKVFLRRHAVADVFDLTTKKWDLFGQVPDLITHRLELLFGDDALDVLFGRHAVKDVLNCGGDMPE